MKQGLFQQQTTKLAMTTELRQAISLLQYSSADLVQFLQETAIENPLLNVDSIHFDVNQRKKQTRAVTKEQPLLVDGESRLTIHEHLSRQVGLLELDIEERKIINYLILFINEQGYFVGDLEEAAQQLGVPTTVLENALRKIQECEPLGIGARDLKECLSIQLKSLCPRNELAELIVTDYLQQLADRKWKEISRKTGAPLDTIQEVFDLIQTLDPRPGGHFNPEKPHYIIPDLIVTKGMNGIEVAVNELLIPKIKIETEYFSYYKIKEHGTHQYIKEKLNQVSFIKRAIEQRYITMKKVMTAIVEAQMDFFMSDQAKLKPLTMKDIAVELDVHESTISRTVNGKYVQTPKGVFELKYFFSSSIQTDNNEDASSQVVKDAIVKLIAEENKKEPLSDQQIANILKEKDNFQVSRRTIAKYRDQLRILPSSKRKRF